jgi:hypothetical protein
VAGAGQLSREEVAAFLCGQPGVSDGPEALPGGAWASRAGGEDLVVRFGREVSWYEADRMAMAFGGPDLPVPEVSKVGTTASGRFGGPSRHRSRYPRDRKRWPPPSRPLSSRA